MLGSRNEPTHLDLFSGIGGFALAAKWAGFRTIGFCEIDKYCQKVLAKNFLADSTEREDWRIQSRGFQSDAPAIHSNIFDLEGTAYRGVDLITGGFPCQPFSVAGKRRGAADDRAIWPEMFRVIKETRPAWVLGENVTGIINMELDNCLSDLESLQYATRTFVVPACAVDAKHRRMRVWIIGQRSGNDSYAESFGHDRRWNGRERTPNEPTRPDSSGEVWDPEPDVGRVAHGIPSRVDRLKGLGNAIVPQVAYQILREIRNLIQ
jgi:DNA (cytosine-5)-methyltransferase 1